MLRYYNFRGNFNGSSPRKTIVEFSGFVFLLQTCDVLVLCTSSLSRFLDGYDAQAAGVGRPLSSTVEIRIYLRLNSLID